MALNGTGSAIYTNCDKVSTGVAPYQTSGLGTNGVWYFANSTNEWSAQSNSTEVIQCGEGFWYNAKQPFIWNAQ